EILPSHAVEARNKGKQLCLGEFGGVKAQLTEDFLQPRRLGGAGFTLPFFWVLAEGALRVVGNHDPLGEFFDRIRWPPPNRDRVKAVLVQDVPDRFSLAREVRDGADAADDRVWLGKSVDAMFVRALSGRD